MNITSEPRTYIGEDGTVAFDGFAGLRISQRYTGVVQDKGAVLVAAVGAPVGTGVVMSGAEWEKWFEE